MIRDVNLKIPDIKAIRGLTRLLGLLGISMCRMHYPPPPAPWTYNKSHPEWSYGFGLKESKDLVERTFHYATVKNSPFDQFQKGNIINEVKRTRQLMNTLNKLGLKSPDAGLKVCKFFVDRMRARPR